MHQRYTARKQTLHFIVPTKRGTILKRDMCGCGQHLERDGHAQFFSDFDPPQASRSRHANFFFEIYPPPPPVSRVTEFMNGP